MIVEPRISFLEYDGRCCDVLMQYNTSKRKKNAGKRRRIVAKNGKWLKSCLMLHTNKMEHADFAATYLLKSSLIYPSFIDTTDLLPILSSSLTSFQPFTRSPFCLSTINHENPVVPDWSSLPNEILLKIFDSINTSDGSTNYCAKNESEMRSTVLAIRTVCRSWNCVAQNSKSLLTCFTPIMVSRFTIAYDAENSVYKLRWCNYGSRKSRTFILPRENVCRIPSMKISFSRLDICRIVFQELRNDTFNDDVVSFICAQFLHCRKFEPKHLCIKNASMSALSSKGLQSLISFTATNLETFEVSNVSGLRPDSITDAHLSELNISKLRRFTIECTKFKNNSKKSISLLQISDKTLEKFACCGHFPSLALERCKVTVNGVVQYMEKWLVKDVETANEILRDVASHMFTLRECPAVSDITFRRECRRRSLDFEEDEIRAPLPDLNSLALPYDTVIENSGANDAEYSTQCSRRSSTESDITSYNIYRMKNVKEFMVTLTPFFNEPDYYYDTISVN